MCMECRRTPCHPQCPNAAPPKPVLYCTRCREGIYGGGRYYFHRKRLPRAPHHVLTERICRSCMEEMPLDDLMGLLDADWSVAEREWGET